MKLEFINGNVIKYGQDFVNDNKYKLRIFAGLSRESLDESIWALMNPEDYNDYTNNVRDCEYKRAAILLNTSIYGPQWGSAVEVPKGTISKLLGRNLTWDDDPVEYKGV